MRDHAERLVEWSGEVGGMKSFRKHAGWYLTGYPVGGVVRKRANVVATLADLDRLIAELDPTAEIQRRTPSAPRGATRTARARCTSPRAGWRTETTRRPPRAPSSSSAAARSERVTFGGTVRRRLCGRTSAYRTKSLTDVGTLCPKRAGTSVRRCLGVRLRIP